MIRTLAAIVAAFLSSFAAFAQVPPPVPALPDAERITAYSISGSTCNCAVNFALYGDDATVDTWVEVWLNGVRYLSTDPTFGWSLSSASGALGSIARPITNAIFAFNSAQTGTVQIVGARRPQRAAQFSENQGVAARDLNVALTDIVAQNREAWDRVNDVTGRALVTQPGNTLGRLPLPGACANSYVAFDGTGLNPLCLPVGGTGNLPTNAAQHVSTEAVLAASSTVTYPNGVWRDSYDNANGAPPLFYQVSNSACSLNAGAGDGGWQVPSSNGKCWIALFGYGSVDMRQWGAPCNGSNDDAPALNKAIAAAHSLGIHHINLCKLVHTNSTVTVAVSNLILAGAGGDIRHNDQVYCGQAGTTWTWGGAGNGTMLTFTTTPGAEEAYGSGLIDACLNGNSNAGIGVLIDTVRGSVMQHLQLMEFTVVGFKTQATVSTNEGIGGFGVQDADWKNLEGVQFATAAPCFYFDGGSNANTSETSGRELTCLHKNANGFEFHNSDNIILFRISTFRAGGGSGGIDGNGGNGVVFFSSNVAGQAANGNLIYHLNSNTPAVMCAALTAGPFCNNQTFASAKNGVLFMDASNSTPAPITQAGAAVNIGLGYYSSTDGTYAMGSSFYALQTALQGSQILYQQTDISTGQKFKIVQNGSTRQYELWTDGDGSGYGTTPSLATNRNFTTFGAPPRIGPVAFAALPASLVRGYVAAISDGLAANCGDTTCTTWGTTITGGGGALTLLAWYNGTNWTLIGK